MRHAPRNLMTHAFHTADKATALPPSFPAGQQHRHYRDTPSNALYQLLVRGHASATRICRQKPAKIPQTVDKKQFTLNF
jgi:hypothetical protein